MTESMTAAQYRATTLELTVSPAPRNANRRRGFHWSAISREKKRVASEVVWQWVEAGKPRFQRVRVHIHRRGWNLVDPYAIGESVKPVLDALTERNGCGCIPDDSSAHVEKGDETQEIDRARPSALVVTLEAI